MYTVSAAVQFNSNMFPLLLVVNAADSETGVLVFQCRSLDCASLWWWLGGTRTPNNSISCHSSSCYSSASKVTIWLRL